MGLCIQYSISGLTLSQAVYEAALLITVLKWVFCWGFGFINNRRNRSLRTTSELSSPSSASSLSCEMTRDSFLTLKTFGDVKERLPETSDTCDVCLNQLKVEEEVRELRSCDHVFHKECIDRWLDYEQVRYNYNPTCPLCRAPLLPFSTVPEISSCMPMLQPSWAVERLLYLFGDDLQL